MVKGSPQSGAEVPIKTSAIYTREEVLAMLAAAEKVAGGTSSKLTEEETWKPVKSMATIKKERVASTIATISEGNRKRKFSPVQRPLSGSLKTC